MTGLVGIPHVLILCTLAEYVRHHADSCGRVVGTGKMGLAAEVEAANVGGGGCSTWATRWIGSVPMDVDTTMERVGCVADEVRL